MSNPSLKEQLQALTLGAPSAPIEKTAVPKNKKKLKSAVSTEKSKKQKPVWLEHAQYGVELLKAYFPAAFKDNKDVQPLKIGIKQDLVKLLSTREDIVIGDKACMVSSLAYYVNSLAYHRSVLAGAARIDLEGRVAGTVTAEEAVYSSDYRKAKLQKVKSKHPASVFPEPSEN